MTIYVALHQSNRQALWGDSGDSMKFSLGAGFKVVEAASGGGRFCGA
jgi:hypothetical protein